MLPEGGHNRSADSTYFIINRKKVKELFTEQQKTILDLNSMMQKIMIPTKMDTLKVLSQRKIEIKLYQIKDLKWTPFYSEQEQRQLSLKVIPKGDHDFCLVVHETQQASNQILEVKSHPFLGFTSYGPQRFSFQNQRGNIFGVEILSSDTTIQDLEVLRFSPYQVIEDELNQSSSTLFFLSIMKNRLDTKAKRGAIVKALAIGSRYRYIESFKGVLNKLLDQIFDIEDLQKSPEENLQKTKQLVTMMFESINKKEIISLMPKSDFIQRKVYKEIHKNLDSSSSDQSLYRSFDSTMNGEKYKYVIPQVQFPDEITTTSIKKFIMKFGEKTMLIYDAILSEKRILFSGGLEFSADEISEYVFACASIISPPLLGVLSKLHPYAALSNLDFIEEPGYIAGVTNPMFKQRQNWHDVCCEIDIGKLKVSKNKDFYNYEQEKYYQLDMDFIRPIIARVKSNSINDEEIKRAFESYTLMLMDMAFKDEQIRTEELIHENDKVIDLLYQRVRRFQRTNLYKIQYFLNKFKEFDLKENISLALIEKLLRRLRISREITDPEVLTIFQQINKYLQDTDSTLKFLYLLPNCREGIVPIAQGLFSANEDIERLATGILRKIEMTAVGKQYLSSLNYFFMLKLQANLNQKEGK